ncbi:outer membrane protein assembly factor BamB family protein, partial [Actinomadura violacea]
AGGAAGAAVLLAGGAALTATGLLGGGGAEAGAADGVWVYDPKGTLSGGPVVLGDLVFATTGIGTATLHAVDRRTGHKRWTAGGVRSPGDLFPLGVAAYGGVVYAPGDDEIIALDRGTGRALWAAPTPGGYTMEAPVIGAGLLFAPQSNAESQVEAYDGRTGAQRWVFDTGGFIRAPLVTDGSLLYALAEGTVFGVETVTGRVRWRHELGRDVEVVGAPVAAGGTLYVIDAKSVLYALDAATGKARWTQRKGGPGSASPQTAVSASGGTVFTGDGSRTVSAFRARDGRPLWRHAFPGRNPDGRRLLPLVAGGVAILSFDDSLYALDAATGRVRWQAGGLTGPDQRPVLAAGAVHLASWDAVVSYDPATGRLLHRRPRTDLQAENLTAAGDVIYWTDGEGLHAAKAPH